MSTNQAPACGGRNIKALLVRFASRTVKPKPPAHAETATFTVAPASPEDDQANARTREKLKKPLSKVDFNGQGLSDVIEFLRDAAGVDILVEWAALEQNGIARETPVTIQLREPTPVDAR